jgi:ABC-2 type transport system ATP-binding protein
VENDVSCLDISKSYGSFSAVQGVSFCARAGAVAGILGENGSGKTTVLKAIAAIHGVTGGKIVVGGIDASERPCLVRGIVGYCAEEAHLINEFTVKEMLAFLGGARGEKKSRKEIAAAVDTVTEQFSLGGVIRTKIARLSKGYARRVSLAAAFLHDPPVLALDEPSSGLDPTQTRELRELLASLSRTKTIILSTHLISEAESLCAQIHIMQKGKLLASGSRDEILSRTKTRTLEEAYLCLTKSPRS